MSTSSHQVAFKDAVSPLRSFRRMTLAWGSAIMVALAFHLAPANAADCIVRHSSTRPADPRISPMTAATSGPEIAYDLTVTNTCGAAIPGVVIDVPIPRGEVYVKTTAKGDGTDRLFSIDGVRYARWDALRKAAAGGGTMPITPSDVKSVRWVFHQPIAPGATAALRYHVLAR